MMTSLDGRIAKNGLRDDWLGNAEMKCPPSFSRKSPLNQQTPSNLPRGLAIALHFGHFCRSQGILELRGPTSPRSVEPPLGPTRVKLRLTEATGSDCRINPASNPGAETRRDTPLEDWLQSRS
jgi:hypothetical protein